MSSTSAQPPRASDIVQTISGVQGEGCLSVSAGAARMTAPPRRSNTALGPRRCNDCSPPGALGVVERKGVTTTPAGCSSADDCDGGSLDCDKGELCLFCGSETKEPLPHSTHLDLEFRRQEPETPSGLTAEVWLAVKGMGCTD
jgi:hypothetical protein